jgi:hypothetical protein
MYPETLYAINEGMYLGLLLLIEAVTLIAALASVLFIILCLVGAACGHFAAPRQPARHQIRPVPPESNEYDLSAVLAGLEHGLDDSLSGSLARQPSASIH